MSSKIHAPFTPEQVKALNEYQQSGYVHPFTCCSYQDCDRGARPDQGILIAKEEGWICGLGCPWSVIKTAFGLAFYFSVGPFLLKRRLLVFE